MYGSVTFYEVETKFEKRALHFDDKSVDCARCEGDNVKYRFFEIFSKLF